MSLDVSGELGEAQNEHLSSVPTAKFEEVMAGEYGHYCLAYELPFLRHLSLVIVALNRNEELNEWALSPDPQQAVLDAILTDADDDKPHNEHFEISSVVALSYALGRTIQSMARYGRSISGLLEDVREKGDQEALFEAVRADRAVLGCPTAMQLIAHSRIHALLGDNQSRVSVSRRRDPISHLLHRSRRAVPGGTP